jgi:hypothetical protein
VSPRAFSNQRLRAKFNRVTLISKLEDFSLRGDYTDADIKRVFRKFGAVVLPGWIEGEEIGALRRDWVDICSAPNDKEIK